MELALWKLKIASMVPVLLRFASIALLAASRPPTAVIMGRAKTNLPSLGANLAGGTEGLNADEISHILPQVHGLVRLSLGDRIEAAGSAASGRRVRRRRVEAPHRAARAYPLPVNSTTNLQGEGVAVQSKFVDV